MNFTQTLESLDLTINSSSVPLVIGESGIGKTALIRKYCKENNLNLVNIDANLLKEGEIGGLPTVIGRETIYATHHKLNEIDRLLRETDKGCMLFIDEINRCDHAVQQELMNLILNREINGYKLDDRVIVTSAMNPSSRMDIFKETDYQVVDMDKAQENRFVWLVMDSDPKEWIIWGMSEGDIHPKVIEFISNFEKYLHSKNENEFIEATPRSWERVSNALKVFNKEKYSESTLYNFVKGNVGASIAQDFITFIKESNNPLINHIELLNEKELSQKEKENIKNTSHSRLYILMINMVNEEKKNHHLEYIERISEVLFLYPKDLRISLMKEIRNTNKETYDKLLKNNTFLEAFFDCYE